MQIDSSAMLFVSMLQKCIDILTYWLKGVVSMYSVREGVAADVVECSCVGGNILPRYYLAISKPSIRCVSEVVVDYVNVF